MLILIIKKLLFFKNMRKIRWGKFVNVQYIPNNDNHIPTKE